MKYRTLSPAMLKQLDLAASEHDVRFCVDEHDTYSLVRYGRRYVLPRMHARELLLLGKQIVAMAQHLSNPIVIEESES